MTEFLSELIIEFNTITENWDRVHRWEGFECDAHGDKVLVWTPWACGFEPGDAREVERQIEI